MFLNFSFIREGFDQKENPLQWLHTKRGQNYLVFANIRYNKQKCLMRHQQQLDKRKHISSRWNDTHSKW